jgi:glycosyltransferase involved in cell wall biosynthesis
MKCSVVVPLHNEEQSVGALLQSLIEQRRQPDEVVIVDAGSQDRTSAIVESYPTPFPLVLLRRGVLFPGSARNEGVLHATHEWIGFTDGGIVLHPDWLAELLAAAFASSVDVVFGTCEPVCRTRFEECAALAYVTPRQPDGLRPPFIASCLVKRSVFEEIGGFPPHRAAEDLIFIERLLKGPYRKAKTAKAVVYWQLASSVTATFRRFSLYSLHNLLAERGRFWHLGLARQYVFVLAVLALGATLGFGTVALLVVPAWFLARALKAAWTNRHSLPFSGFHPGRLLGVAGLLSVIDLATLAGTARFVKERWGRAS